MDWGDIPTWIAGVGGVIGAGGGIFGTWQARRARETADSGNKIAKTANQLSQDANELAKRANETSAESNGIAREANRIAVGANELAEEANTLTKRAHARETERHDVHWEGGWETPGRYVLVNRGEDEAFDVSVMVTVDEETVRARLDRVGPGEPVALEFPRALKEFRREQASLRRDQARPGPFSVPDLVLPPQHQIEERITWVSERGVPHSHHEQDLFASLSEVD